MALLIKTKIPLAIGLETENLYLKIAAQATDNITNEIQYACVFYVSESARQTNSAPVAIGKHPISILANAIKNKLSEVISTDQLPESITVNSRHELYSAMTAEYYAMVKEMIDKINQEYEVNIAYENC